MAKAAPAASKSTAVAKAKSNLPANLNAAYAAEMAALQKRLQAPTGDRIAATQSKTFKLPNGTEVEELEVIVVDFVAANFYYSEGFDRNNIVPPECFAIGLEPAGLVPSDNSPDKQCDSCSACWANAYKSARTGNGKACGNTRMLAVLTPDADVDSPLYTLKVSATAIASFDGHVNKVARALGKPIRAAVTRVYFSEAHEYATMRFDTIEACTPDQEALAFSRLEEAQTRLMTEPDVSALQATNEAKIKAPAKGNVKKAPVRAAAGRR